MSHDQTDACVRLPVFPLCPDNRPGLSQIAYRIGTYAQIREAMFHRLNRDPVLLNWTHRAADDPGIALLEGAAILGDILTFYQEQYANEAYLRTARWRESIADLVRLVGYRLAPGLGGRAVFALDIRGDQTVVVPRGFAISAQVTGLPAQADFQTAEDLTAYPWLSSFNLYRPAASPAITSTTQELLLLNSGSASEPQLQPGDRLLLGQAAVGLALAGVEIVVVEAVRQRHGQTLCKLKTPLQQSVPSAELRGFKIGRSFRHFGHNSPPQTVTLNDQHQASPCTVSFVRRLDVVTDRNPPIAALDFPLDSKVDDLGVGTTLVCHIDPPASPPARQTVYRTITRVRQGSQTWGALTGATTVVTLSARLFAGPQNFNPTVPDLGAATTVALTSSTSPQPATAVQTSGAPHAADTLDIRTIAFHEALTPLLHFAARPEPTPSVRGNSPSFFGTAVQAQVLTGRQLLLSAPDQEPEPLRVQSVSVRSGPDRPGLQALLLDRELEYGSFPLENPHLTVYGNLVEATQGKAERQTALGNGDSAQVFQTFKLPKSPLTYLNVAGETPPHTPELQIYVGGRLWKRVDTLFNSSSSAEHYIVREDANGDSWVQFGDGKSGRRLPSGVDNVEAGWRTGVGAYGGLNEGASPQPGGRLDRLSAIVLPGIVTGGEQPETADNARAAAPGKIQSLDRLVSLADFETEALATAGVSRATAVYRLEGGVPAVVITALMDTGRDAEFDSVRSIIAIANRTRGPARCPVFVHAGHRVYFFLAATLGVDPVLQEDAVLADVRLTLGLAGLSGSIADGTGNRNFGERVHAAQLEGVIQNVTGVRWVRLTALQCLGPSLPVAPPDVRRLDTRLVPNEDAILALHADSLRLTLTPAPSSQKEQV